LGAGNPDTIRMLVNLSILHQETGDLAAARGGYERALVLAEQMETADPPTLHVLTGAAVVLSELGGDFSGSARLNERLLALMERAFGSTDPRLTTPLENLAIDLRDLGDYAGARRLAERAVSIAERAFGSKHAELARSLHTLATILARMGDYAGAMTLFERATRINEEVRHPTNPERARASWFIPDLFPLSGYDSEDMQLFERLLASREAARRLGYPHTAEVLGNLAAVLSTPEDYRRTRPLFERALESQEQFLGPDHPALAAVATGLAQVLWHSGEDARARSLYERALGIWEKSLGADHPKVATALVNLARFHIAAGNPRDAEPLLARALSIQEKSLGPEHPEVAVTLAGRAELLAQQGPAIEAFETAARAEALSREHLRMTVRTLPERQALSYATSALSPLNLILRLASTRSDDARMSTTAWDAVIRARGLVLDEMAARHAVASSADDQETAALAKELAAARQRLAAAVVRGIGDEPPERYRRLLDEARRGKDQAERNLAEKSARFRVDQSRSRVGLSDLLSALPDGGALVGYVSYASLERSGPNTTTGADANRSYLAFVVRRGERVPAVVPIGKASKVDALILKWRRQLDQEAMAAGRTGPRSEAAYRRVAGELRQQIWDPLLPHLSNATRVFVVPDGALHLVSFAAFPAGAGQYLVETDRVIHYLSAERDLVSGEATPPTGTGLLALGGPAFDESSPMRASSESAFRGTRSSCGDFQSMQFGPLPASLKEVDQVVALWNHALSTRPGGRLAGNATPMSSAVRLTGTAASEAAFKTEAAGRRILHLATHGFFLGGRCTSVLAPPSASAQTGRSARITRENPLLLSGLILAGANRRNAAAPDQEDGVLTAEEVAAMNLSGVEWAVLSGCDTGVGEIRASEGVFGLRRAFHVAGARTVIMSLWPVEDRATYQWMTTLYDGRLLKKLSTAQAVREATLAVLRERRAKGLTGHPFYWAAFVAAGDWR
jgi:CHAT domain-containing protein/tetratricopeptide (TPR) repeat protein